MLFDGGQLAARPLTDSPYLLFAARSGPAGQGLWVQGAAR